MAHVSRWLESRALGVGDLTADRVEEFVEVRRAAGYTDLLSQRALTRLQGYLDGPGGDADPPGRAAVTPAELLVEEYRSWLTRERGLTEGSVAVYLGAVRLFLSERERPVGSTWQVCVPAR